MKGKKQLSKPKPKTERVLSTPLAQVASGKEALQWAAAAPSCPSDGRWPMAGPSPLAARPLWRLASSMVVFAKGLMGTELVEGMIFC